MCDFAHNVICRSIFHCFLSLNTTALTIPSYNFKFLFLFSVNMVVQPISNMQLDFMSCHQFEKKFWAHSQPVFTCLKLLIETLEQGVKYVQSWTYFTPCSSVSTVNIEHVIAGWICLKMIWITSDFVSIVFSYVLRWSMWTLIQ